MTTALRSVFRLVLPALLLASFAVAAARADGVPPVNGRTAVHGYDAVAYFTNGQAVKGNREFEYVWNGATWRFTSQANLEAFTGNPGKYAPQYGGYCAYAVSQGYTADTDPEAFTIVNGKLYLNYSKSVKRKWDTDQAGYIAKGDTNWPKLIRQ